MNFGEGRRFEIGVDGHISVMSAEDSDVLNFALGPICLVLFARRLERRLVVTFHNAKESHLGRFTFRGARTVPQSVHVLVPSRSLKELGIRIGAGRLFIIASGNVLVRNGRLPVAALRVVLQSNVGHFIFIFTT